MLVDKGDEVRSGKKEPIDTRVDVVYWVLLGREDYFGVFAVG